MHFETGPKFVSTEEFPQINGMGLIHKSAAGTELSALSLRPTHTQSGERVLIQGVKLKTKRQVLMMLNNKGPNDVKH